MSCLLVGQVATVEEVVRGVLVIRDLPATLREKHVDHLCKHKKSTSGLSKESDINHKATCLQLASKAGLIVTLRLPPEWLVNSILSSTPSRSASGFNSVLDRRCPCCACDPLPIFL